MTLIEKSQAQVPKKPISDTSPSAKEKFKKNGMVGDVTTAAGQAREKDVTLFVPFTYLSTFFRSLEMPLINCEIELQLTWSKTCLVGYTHNNNDATLVAGAAATGTEPTILRYHFKLQILKHIFL